MQVVHTTVPVEPGCTGEARELASWMVERSRSEDGTVAYHAAVDVDDAVVHFVERYADAEAFAAHGETDHYETFIERLLDLVDDGREMETVVVESAAVERAQFDAAELAETIE